MANDLLNAYFKNIQRYKPLTTAQEAELAARIQAGDTKAQEALIFSNLRFVVSVAKEYSNQGLDLLDLIAIGNMGLIRASKKFDASKNFRFISYAVWWIRQSILSALSVQSRATAVPSNRINDIYTIRRTQDRLTQKLQRTPTPEELSTELSFKPERIKESQLIDSKSRSLDSPIDHNNITNTSTLGDLLPWEPQESDLEESLETMSWKKVVQDAFKNLTPREQIIVQDYYGFNNTNYRSTLEEIGNKVNLTRERVRQIKDLAIQKLRKHINRETLFA